MLGKRRAKKVQEIGEKVDFQFLGSTYAEFYAELKNDPLFWCRASLRCRKHFKIHKIVFLPAAKTRRSMGGKYKSEVREGVEE